MLEMNLVETMLMLAVLLFIAWAGECYFGG
jgi:hypothetical protein